MSSASLRTRAPRDRRGRARRRTTVGVLAASAGVVLLLALVAAGPAGAVTPVFVAGNPTCVGQGYDFGFKVDPPNSGTYSIDGVNTVTVTTDGVYFDWSSTLGMDAVISKGGPNANVYVYDPPTEAFSDTGLHSPINASNGQPYGLSHIEFCYDYELTVSKTATTTFTRTFNWSIDKSVTPATWNLFKGDSGTSLYTVAVTKTGYTDSNWAVSGTITIHNGTPIAATVASVADEISPNLAANVTCGVSFPYSLAAGGTLSCTYSRALPDGTTRLNTATVATTGQIEGGTGTANVTFGQPTTVVNGTIDVTDTNGGSWQFSDSGSATYSKTFACDADEGTHNNTATITQTGQSDGASVAVTCNDLTVTKTANTSFTRSWTWTIDKLADQSSLLLSDGQLFPVNYSVTVNATPAVSNAAVSGTITVHNPATIAAKINSVADIVSPSITANVSCGVTFPYTLAAGGTLNCTYSANLPNTTSRTNTATATLQNYAYSSTGVATPSGTTDFSGTANVTFSSTPTTETDECITVSDTNDGTLGTVCAGEAPKTFTYTLWFGKHPDADVQLVCGNNTHLNTASFVTNDTSATGSDNWTVTANVACDFGCTLTPGYWKTHSVYGPAPYDDTWALLGEDTSFYLSGQSYYQVLWTPPTGNPYYILAHAYIAAKLNVLNGASTTPAVLTAMTSAESFFSAHAPDEHLSRALRNQVIALAGTLDSYNNGYIGPGHCSE